MAASSLPHPYDEVYRELGSFIPETRLISDPLRNLAYGTDASFYRLIPKLVVEVVDENEVVRTLRLAGEWKTPVTFRAAGTSLSGQAVTDSILIRLGTGWREHRANADGSEITLQPGVIGGHANARLATFDRKIGPDPASIDAAKIGGIAANNASGMCCGTAQNSYKTLKSMRVVLADGSVVDTGEAASREAFAASHRELLDDLDSLARDTRANTPLADRIRDKFRIKNTTGYSLNALVDFENPFEILQHLMIGSEGTLGFISEITLHTVEEHRHKASALILFPEIHTACRAVAVLKKAPVAAVELMDRAALRSVETKPGMPDFLRGLPGSATALLVETRGSDRERLAGQIAAIGAALSDIETLFPVDFTDEAEEYAKLWKIRKGLFPAVGAVREAGTTVVIEDVAFDVSRLADATLDLQSLLGKHGYHEAIIFGHALEGNVHFVFTQDFGRTTEVDRYGRFMDELCHMVVDTYDGSLKAEHSTGRNMAPYVELEWGADAYRLMKRIKAIFDPHNILNPGVILNDDPQVHLENLKPMPAVDPLVDTCIECGFCEPWCPSRALTLTPRQRIVGLRELARLEAADGDDASRRSLRALYQYQAIDTCAGDGLCSLACPVEIDTGKMMKALRGREMGSFGRRVADVAANNYALVSSAMRLGLAAGGIAEKVVGKAALVRMTGAVRKSLGDRVPAWNAFMPTAAAKPKARPKGGNGGKRVVYFPSCASQTMGPANGDPERESLFAKTEALLRKAGYDVVYPEKCGSLCCGTPFESKGAAPQAEAKLRELESALMDASGNGRDPVVVDTSLCSYRLIRESRAPIRVFDIVEFIHDVLPEQLVFRRVPETVAIHATCSVVKLGTADKLKRIAEWCAEEVVVPDDITCCGWAGDKGFTVPEINANALRNLRSQLPPECTAGYSTSRTCEIGLSMHSGRHYRSIVYLVDRCTESAAHPDPAASAARPLAAQP
jgi:D-lactate dehydrogenase